MGNPICWAELTTWKPGRRPRVLRQALRWQIKPMPDAALPYLTFDPGQGPGGGIMGLPEPGIPTAWSIYVKVDDLKATCRRLEELGGKVHKPPTEYRAAAASRWPAIPRAPISASGRTRPDREHPPA